MKSSTLHRHSILLKADAADGGKKEEKKPDPQPTAKADEKAEDKKPDEKAEKELTPEELKQQQRELKDMTRGAGRKKTVEKKVEEKPVAKVEDKPADKAEGKKPDAKVEEKKPDPKPAPAKQPAAKREPVDVPPPIGAEEPVERKIDKPELKTELELPTKDKRKLRVLQQMEEDGTVEKGFAEKTLRFWEKEAKYQEQWEAAHPGEDFDDQAEEHKAFYKSEPLYDADEYDMSRDNLVKAEARQETEGKHTEQEKVTKRRQEFQDAQKGIAEDSQRAVMEFIEVAAPELAELMGNGDGKALTKEITEKMMAKDPVVTEILQETAEELAVLTVELHRLTQFDDVWPAKISQPLTLKVSGRRIYPHADLLNFMRSLEGEMLQMPPEQTMRGKQRLVTNSGFNNEYNRIAKDGTDAKAKREAVAALNANYYTLTEGDFRRGLIATYADTAKREIEKFTKRVGHRTPKPPEAGAAPTPEEGKKEADKDEKKEEKVAEEETPRGTRTRSPSTASASDAVDTGARGGKETVTDGKSAVARSRGR